MDAMAFLDKTGKSKRQAVYVVKGDEEFLKRLVFAEPILRRKLTEPEIDNLLDAGGAHRLRSFPNQEGGGGGG